MLMLQTALGDASPAAPELEALISRMAEGDTDALREFYGHKKSSVYGFALSMLKNRHDAEDVLQDCFVSVYRAAATYRPRGKPMAWVLTIARNLCLMRIRERSRVSDLPEEDWEPYLSDNAAFTPDDKLVLRQCMEVLGDDERQIVILHAAAGFKHREIAGIMDMPLPTVLSKYSRALKKLRSALERAEASEGAHGKES